MTMRCRSRRIRHTGDREPRMRPLLLGFYLSFSVTAASSQDSTVLRRGEALLTRDCAGCHAIARTGESRHPQAPLFRTLERRYPIESLEEALGEGIISGHPDMPEFKFEGDDVGAIIAYLKSIQER
jgi:cytochrome c